MGVMMEISSQNNYIFQWYSFNLIICHVISIMCVGESG